MAPLFSKLNDSLKRFTLTLDGLEVHHEDGGASEEEEEEEEEEEDAIVESLIQGLRLTEAERADLFEAWKTKGKKLTAEHRKKISDALKGRGTHKTKAFKGGAVGAGTGKGALAKRHPVGTRVHTKDGVLTVTGHTSGYIGVEGGKKKWYKLNELQNQAPKVAAKTGGKVDGSGLKTKAKGALSGEQAPAVKAPAVKAPHPTAKHFGAPESFTAAEYTPRAKVLKELGWSADNFEARVHALTGGVKGASIEVETQVSKAGTMYLSMSSRYIKNGVEFHSSREISKDPGKPPELFNHSLDVRGLESGAGTQVLLNQAREAQKAGFKFMKTDAASGEDGWGRPYNGYYTWARLGYDGPVKGPTGQTVQVSELMKTPEGRAWWKKNGETINGATFDLTPGSQSMRVLESYAKAKGLSDE